MASPPSETRPFAPSWVDHVLDWIERLPGPSWAFYVGVWLAAGIVVSGVRWLDGETMPTWPWQPDTLRSFVTALVLPLVLWLITRALDRFAIP